MGLFGNLFAPNVEKLAHREDVSGLLKVLEGRYPEKAQEAFDALVALGNRDLEQLVAKLDAGLVSDRALARIINGAGEQAKEALLAAILAGRYSASTIKAIGILGEPRAVEALVAVVSDSSLRGLWADAAASLKSIYHGGRLSGNQKAAVLNLNGRPIGNHSDQVYDASHSDTVIGDCCSGSNFSGDVHSDSTSGGWHSDSQERFHV